MVVENTNYDCKFETDKVYLVKSASSHKRGNFCKILTNRIEYTGSYLINGKKIEKIEDSRIFHLQNVNTISYMMVHSKKMSHCLVVLIMMKK